MRFGFPRCEVLLSQNESYSLGKPFKVIPDPFPVYFGSQNPNTDKKIGLGTFPVGARSLLAALAGLYVVASLWFTVITSVSQGQKLLVQWDFAISVPT